MKYIRTKNNIKIKNKKLQKVKRNCELSIAVSENNSNSTEKDVL